MKLSRCFKSPGEATVRGSGGSQVARAPVSLLEHQLPISFLRSSCRWNREWWSSTCNPISVIWGLRCVFETIRKWLHRCCCWGAFSSFPLSWWSRRFPLTSTPASMRFLRWSWKRSIWPISLFRFQWWLEDPCLTPSWPTWRFWYNNYNMSVWVERKDCI